MTTAISNLDADARAVLSGNDRGGYTVPSAGLYPYQWNWDSVFTALGFMTFDEDRAWREIEALFEAQWANGMVPHIIFRGNDSNYFPGPDVWGADQQDLPWPTSAISQPPAAATIVRWMLQQATDPDAARQRLRGLFPKLLAWHRWWHSARDPDGLGIIAVSHPWESGRDNLPDWDRPGEAVDVSAVGDYRRRDTGHVDPEMRPGKADYDRYLALLQFGRERAWDQRHIAAENPFWVADVGVTAILLRAERDLMATAQALGEAEVAAEIAARIGRMEAGFERLWNPACGAYCSLDLRSGQHAEAATAATFLCWYAGSGSAARWAELRALFLHWAQRVTFMVPSFDPFNPHFDALRYWRGPVWAIVNFLVGTGLAEAGETELAGQLRADTRALISEHGFAEYYSALDGQPAGGKAFSWTAAIWLAWASPRADASNATLQEMTG